MSDEEIDGLDANDDGVLEGERGLPSVNTRRRKDNSTLFKLAVVTAVVIGALALLARAFAGHGQVPQTQMIKDEVGNTLPAMPEMPDLAPPSTPDAARHAARRPQPANNESKGMTPEQSLMARRQRAPILAYGAGDGGGGAPGGLLNQALSAARPGGAMPVFAAPAVQSQSKTTWRSS